MKNQLFLILALIGLFINPTQAQAINECEIAYEEINNNINGIETLIIRFEQELNLKELDILKLRNMYYRYEAVLNFTLGEISVLNYFCDDRMLILKNKHRLEILAIKIDLLINPKEKPFMDKEIKIEQRI